MQLRLLLQVQRTCLWLPAAGPVQRASAAEHCWFVSTAPNHHLKVCVCTTSCAGAGGHPEAGLAPQVAHLHPRHRGRVQVSFCCRACGCIGNSCWRVLSTAVATAACRMRFECRCPAEHAWCLSHIGLLCPQDQHKPTRSCALCVQHVPPLHA